jgi:hypothetical protein
MYDDVQVRRTSASDEDVLIVRRSLVLRDVLLMLGAALLHVTISNTSMPAPPAGDDTTTVGRYDAS